MVLSFIISSIVILMSIFFQRKTKFSVVQISSVCTIIAGLIMLALKIDSFSYYLQLIFGASFVGMTDQKHTTNKLLPFLVILYPLIFVYIYPNLPIQGGALGFSAFLSVLFSFLLKKLIFDKKIAN